MTAYQTDWHKLDRDRTIAMIDSVKSAGDHIVFSHTTSEAKCARLSFYRNLLLYRLTNYASLPSFSFDYLGDGKTFFHLDGSPTSIYHANDTFQLILNRDTVLDYIIFFFNHVSGPDGDIYVIGDLDDHPALDSLDLMQMDDLIARFQQPEIISKPDGGFTVKTILFYLGSLVQAVVDVTQDGRVDVIDSRILMTAENTIDMGASA